MIWDIKLWRCGGPDLGFEKAGFDIIWANDFDADAQAVYRLNLGEIDGRNILAVGEDEIPDCDILTAGFPSEHGFGQNAESCCF